MKVYTLTLVDLQSVGYNPKYAMVFENINDANTKMKTEYEESLESLKDKECEISLGSYAYINGYYYWDIFESEIVEMNQREKTINKTMDYLKSNYSESFKQFEESLRKEVENYVEALSDEMITSHHSYDICEAIVLDIIGSTLIHKATDKLIGDFKMSRDDEDMVHDYVGEGRIAKFFINPNDCNDCYFDMDEELYALMSVVYGNQYFDMDKIMSMARENFELVTNHYVFNSFMPNNLAKNDATESYFLQIVTLYLLSGGNKKGKCLYHYLFDNDDAACFNDALDIAYNVSKMFYEKYKRTLFDNGIIEEYLAFFIKNNLDEICKNLNYGEEFREYVNDCE